MLTLFMVAATHATAPAAPGDAEPGTTLDVCLEGIEHPTGQILLSVFDSEAAYDGGGAPVRATAVPVTGPSAVARFDGLAPGAYAIKAFHDVDGDGRMNANPFGMPLEPFAFSNNAKADGGPARWQATHFSVAPGHTQIRIAIK